MRRGQIPPQLIAPILVVIVIALLSVGIQQERTRLEVSIFDKQIEDTSIQQETVPYISSLVTPNRPQGPFTLRISVENTNNTRVYEEAVDNLGEGISPVILPSPTYPNGVWTLNLELVRFNLEGDEISLDEYCREVNWENGQIESISIC